MSECKQQEGKREWQEDKYDWDSFSACREMSSLSNYLSFVTSRKGTKIILQTFFY